MTMTILPTFKPAEYLESLMSDMLNCKRTFADSINKQRPWMKQQRNPIGSNTVQQGITNSQSDSEEGVLLENNMPKDFPSSIPNIC